MSCKAVTVDITSCTFTVSELNCAVSLSRLDLNAWRAVAVSFNPAGLKLDKSSFHLEID